VLRRCVWSRNIKNGCSIYIYIYIYDISRLRVKITSRRRTLPEKLQVIHLAKTTSVLYGNTNLLLKITRDHNWSPTWARWIQHTPTFTSYFLPFHFNNTLLLFVGPPYGPFSSDFSTNFRMHFPTSPPPPFSCMLHAQ